jgi:hypothetical protein
MTDRCESCGVPFTEHAGIIGTCAKARQARIRVRVLEHAIARALQATCLDAAKAALRAVPKGNE